MSRTPESNLENQKRLFQEIGIFFKIGPDDRLMVELKGSHGNFPLTGWFEQETHDHAEIGPKNRFFPDLLGGEKITVRVEGTSPVKFILNLLHEMGHGFGNRLPGYMHSLELDLLPSDINDPDERLKAKIQALAKHEQEAWEMALRMLITVYQKTGWDIRTLVSSPEELVAIMEIGFYSYRDNIQEFLRQRGKEKFTPVVQASFDTSYLKFIAKQFWEKF